MKINILEFKYYAQGVFMQVGIIRPYNAPRYKYTEADGKRKRLLHKINSRIVEEERYFESTQTAISWLISNYPKNTYERY